MNFSKFTEKIHKRGFFICAMNEYKEDEECKIRIVIKDDNHNCVKSEGSNYKLVFEELFNRMMKLIDGDICPKCGDLMTEFRDNPHTDGGRGTHMACENCGEGM